MGYAVHQVLVEPTAKPLTVSILLYRTALMVVNGRLTLDDFLNQFLRFVNAIRDRYPQDGSAVKPCQVNVFIRSDNDAVAGGNFLLREDIFCTAGSLGFRFHADNQAPALSFPKPPQPCRYGQFL